MKQITVGIILAAIPLASNAQVVQQVYNRDSGEHFNIKKVVTDSVIKGPMVKQKSVFTFDNPSKRLTEASFWFSLPTPGVLSGFAYWYQNEFVPGVLMDKQKAWFIYTAITSRNEDPGIMVQTSPSSYHAQIFPLAIGYDLRVQLTTLGFLESDEKGLLLPEPDITQISQGNNVPQVNNFKQIQPEVRKVVEVNGVRRTVIADPLTDETTMQYYAQKHKDGHTYVVGMIHTKNPDDPFQIKGLTNVFWARPENGPDDGSVKLFMGRRNGAGKIQVVSDKSTKTEILKGTIHANERGTDTAKLWAHQKLNQTEWRRNKDVLNFSLKYQIPSSQTALLAVPSEQMKLFRAKAAEYERKQKAEARRQREWQKNREMNWRDSSGGDPEIRVLMPEAVKVVVTLPDGKEFELKKDAKGFWGGNFDIPAEAPEGDYSVKLTGTKADGSTFEKFLHYQVDRTAPTGEIKVENGFYVLKANETLARAVAVFGSGQEVNMIPNDEGNYEVPIAKGRLIKVMLIDNAHNVREIKWSH
jgi:Vault protein inter-alpha-trypsin domain